MQISQKVNSNRIVMLCNKVSFWIVLTMILKLEYYDDARNCFVV